MSVEALDGEEHEFVSVPRGGPIFVENMVSPLTSVPEFELSVFNQLQSLKAEVDWDSCEPCDDDLSVDELKIIKDEDLVNKVFEEAFQEEKLASQVSDQLNHGTLTSEENTEEIVGERDASNIESENTNSNAIVTRSARRRQAKKPKNCPLEEEKLASQVSDQLNHGTLTSEENTEEIVGERDASNVESENTNSNAIVSRRARGRGPAKKLKNCPLEEKYITKVERVAKIKEKQEEDKAAARLHSFNGSSSGTKAKGSSDKVDRMKSLRSTSSSTKVKLSGTSVHIPIHFPEVVLCVEVYHSRKTWLKTQEFWVLGRQFLTELRDKICCLIDEIMEKAGRYDPSGYFLIEDVFCNDLRQPCATNYSKPILEWLENSRFDALKKWECIASGNLENKQKEVLGDQAELQLPRFKTSDMRNTRFCDLKFRLGAGYLYCHQGDCKHAIVIRDMRLIQPEDVQNRLAYPLVTFQTKPRVRKCSVCKIFRATKVTVDDKWAGENPCYFCDLCYYMVHYVDGNLLYDDFSVYPYFHD